MELIFPAEIKFFILVFFYGKLKMGKTVWGREAGIVWSPHFEAAKFYNCWKLE
jgi:hypothetical protein